MEKLKMESQDIVGSNINKIAQLFPNCVTERKGKDGKTELAIDFEKLQAELSDDIIGEGEERYQFTWPDKRAANRLANTPTTMTLRPCREDSVDFDKTQNIYIEGDNLDVLKVLRETYLGKVKMIYIDPPYNTGNDFVYNDDFAKGKDKFEQTSGFFDEEGNQTVDPMQRNTESNGRFHTDWLNMMYPRLKVARDLLTDDGVIFISIDDGEIANLTKICNEVFGEGNLLGIITWSKKRKGSFLSKGIISLTEYVLVYCKNRPYFKGLFGGIADVNESQPIIKRTNKISVLSIPANVVKSKIPDGKYTAGNYGDNINPVRLLDDIEIINSKIINAFRIEAPFIWSQRMFDEQLSKGATFVINTLNFQIRVFRIYDDDNFKGFSSFINGVEIKGTNEDAYEELESFFGIKKIFDYSKPTNYIKEIIKAATHFDKKAIILDFFSGSATTAHAVMKLNAEDGGNRKFIMVQLPELTDKNRYKNICEIGEERIRRAGKKIVKDLKSEIDTKERLLDRILNAEPSATVKILPIEEQKEIAKKVYEEKAVPLMKEIDEIKERIEKLDTGFRVFKLDTSNMEDVYYTPQEFDEQKLFTDNVKADRTNEDLLFQVMLDLGIELSAKIEVKEIAGKTVHIVDENYLVACFDEDVNETTIKEIAKLKPVYFVMRDASAANDNVIDNFEQIFRHYSPETTCRIL